MLRFEGHSSTELNGEGKLACPRLGVLDAHIPSGGLYSPEPALGLNLQAKDTLKAFKGFHLYLDR